MYRQTWAKRKGMCQASSNSSDSPLRAIYSLNLKMLQPFHFIQVSSSNKSVLVDYTQVWTAPRHNTKLIHGKTIEVHNHTYWFTIYMISRPLSRIHNSRCIGADFNGSLWRADRCTFRSRTITQQTRCPLNRFHLDHWYLEHSRYLDSPEPASWPIRRACFATYSQWCG